MQVPLIVTPELRPRELLHTYVRMPQKRAVHSAWPAMADHPERGRMPMSVGPWFNRAA